MNHIELCVALRGLDRSSALLAVAEPDREPSMSWRQHLPYQLTPHGVQRRPRKVTSLHEFARLIGA